jgi:hypothetical protein
MIPLVKDILQLLKELDNLKSTANMPEAGHLFKVNKETTPLTQEGATLFHNFITKYLFLGNFFTKPLHGKLFYKFGCLIMNLQE